VHYWADLQSVHGFRCYDNIARTRNVSECLYSLYAWFLYFVYYLVQVCTSRGGHGGNTGTTGMYFSAIMFMCSLSVVCTVLVLNCHHRSPDTHVMPNWVCLLVCLFVCSRRRQLREDRGRVTRILSRLYALGNPQTKYLSFLAFYMV